jgi:hypothetical protein
MIDIAVEKAALELQIMEEENGFEKGYAKKLDPTGQ